MLNSNKKTLFQIGNLAGYIITVFVNFLANALPINGVTTGELSDSYPNLFVPAGLTFSIWGVIYVLLFIFSIYQIRDIVKKEKIEMDYLDKIGIFFILSSAANSAWIFFWHYRLVLLSLLAMLVLLISLILIYTSLNIGRAEVSHQERIAVHLPFSVYLGWITVATIANVTALLVDSGVPSFTPIAEIWTVLVIIVAVIITYLMLIRRKDIGYSLVVVWASLGIFIKQITLNITIGITALIAMLALIIGIVLVIIRDIKKS